MTDRSCRGTRGRPWLRFHALGLLLLVFQAACAAAAQEPIDAEGRRLPVLRSGWYLWDPYQFNDTSGPAARLAGLDVELSRAVARQAGFAVDLGYVAWRRHIEQLRTGERDMAAGATYTPERAAFVHFSRPYRLETNALFLARGDAARYAFDDVAGMLETFRRTGFRLGVIDGFAYADPAVNAYVADPSNADRVVPADNDYQNFRNLLDGGIDGFLADRVVAATSAWRGGWRDRVEEHPFRFSTEIRFMFSKATVPPETVQRFDEAIVALERNGETRRIVANYLFPILLAQTLDSDWFLLLDIVGTVAFALSGVLIARRERYSLVGALVLAALPAVGGGVVRDLLVGREPLAVLASPLYLVLVGSTVLVGFALVRMAVALDRRALLPERIVALARHRASRDLYELSDAVGLAAFTVIGVAVAVGAKAEPLWLWGPLLAMLTAAGGGMLRDLVRQSGGIAALRGEFYAEVPLLWGLALSLYLTWKTPQLEPEQLAFGVIVTLAGAFATRTAAVLFRLRGPAFD